MRQMIGTVILFSLGLVLTANGSWFGMVLLAFGISAIAFAVYPSPFGMPGFVAAMLVGSVVLIAFLAAGIDGFFDDC